MLNVLIVDDDTLVRKGMKQTMPWKSFGMDVVGEAENGQEALDFIEHHPIDVVFTDLEMPVMKGFELIRILQNRYPQVYIVVLTLYQNFEYIQTCLRAGAIDYITKLQLEQEQMNSVLSRIADRINKENNNKSKRHSAFTQESIKQNDIYVIVAMDGKLYKPLDLNTNLKLIDKGIWMGLSSAEKNSTSFFLRLVDSNITRNLALIHFSCTADYSMRDLQLLVRLYCKKYLFYDYNRNKRIIHTKLSDSYIHSLDSDKEKTDKIWQSMMSFDWMRHDNEYHFLLEEINSAKLMVSVLNHIIDDVIKKWNNTFGLLTGQDFVKRQILCWDDAKDLLKEMKNTGAEIILQKEFSPEIVYCIITALNIIKEESNLPLTAKIVSERVNLSRSYFNSCFKKIVGISFHEKIKVTRLEKAKQYLGETVLSIKSISEIVGYQDEKHFSRLFCDATGILPSKYRERQSN